MKAPFFDNFKACKPRKKIFLQRNSCKAWLCILLMSLFAFVSAFGCTSAQVEMQEDPAHTQARYVIGVSFPTMKLIYRQTMYEILEQNFINAKEKGIEFIVYDADGSQQRQNQDILDLVEYGVDGIILIPYTTDGPVSAIQYANEKGIPVITVDNVVEARASAQVISFVGADHYRMGKQSAELLLSVLEERFPHADKWNVIQLTGIPGASGTIDRGIAIDDMLMNTDRVRLIGSFNAEFTRENARSVMEDCLLAFDEIHGVICQNDLMALGCYDAIEAVGKLDEIIVIGIDGQEEVVSKMVEGGLHGTVIQYPNMILKGVDVLCDYLDGKPIQECYYLETDIITQGQAQEYLDKDLPW